MKITKETLLSSWYYTESWCQHNYWDNLTPEEWYTLECIIENCFTEGIDETTLNDTLRFDRDWVFEMLDITEDEYLERE